MKVLAVSFDDTASTSRKSASVELKGEVWWEREQNCENAIVEIVGGIYNDDIN